MVETAVEILVVLAGMGFLVWAIKSMARQGNLGEVKTLMGEAFILPHTTRSDEQKNRLKKL